MINWNSFKNPMKIELPYVFFILTNLVTVTAQEQLFVQYPEFGAFNLSSRLTGNKKHYKFGVVSLFSNNMKTENLKLLNPCWEELINEISSKKYLSQVMQLVDEDLFTCELTISLFSFPEGGWVSPHVDNTNKVLTQIFYFNTEWSPQEGGCLGILKSESMDSLCFKILPLSYYSVLLPRSEQAWHMVESVNSGPKKNRLTMQVEFWRNTSE